MFENNLPKGLEIIAAARRVEFDRRWVIIADRGESAFQRFVVSDYTEGCSEWESGTYTASLPEAYRIFAVRLAGIVSSCIPQDLWHSDCHCGSDEQHDCECGITWPDEAARQEVR